MSSSSYEHYKYLKSLSNLLCSLGVHLAEIWSYIMKTPPNFSLYLSALAAFFVHPSLVRFLNPFFTAMTSTKYGWKCYDIFTGLPRILYIEKIKMLKKQYFFLALLQLGPTTDIFRVLPNLSGTGADTQLIR